MVYTDEEYRRRIDDSCPPSTCSATAPCAACSTVQPSATLDLDAPAVSGPGPRCFRCVYLTGAPGRWVVDTLLVGKAHGDLSGRNILIPSISTVQPSNFELIDYDHYTEDAPLARDPMHLLVTLVILAGSSLVVGVAAMVHVHYDDLAFLFVNAIADAVLAPARAPESDERRLQRRTDTLGCLVQRSHNEFPRGEGGGRRQLFT
jgi:hypothetical protein